MKPMTSVGLVARLILGFATILVLLPLGCSNATSGEGEIIEPSDKDPSDTSGSGSGDSANSSSSQKESSSSEVVSPGDSSETPSKQLSAFLKMVDIPTVSLSRGAASYKVSAFSIGQTEVTQGLYKQVMDSLPTQPFEGDSIAVAHVSWFDAARFCNKFSKKIGLDTAYVYESVGERGQLLQVSVNPRTKAVRLPTEIEWEVAARGGSQDIYYWGVEVASNYAYYAQSKGPVKVAGYLPNAYGLYDVGGNVAEWTGDWYAAFPSSDKVDYAGPETGEYRVVRGGGWPDKVKAMALSERDKKVPQFTGAAVGFRIVLIL